MAAIAELVTDMWRIRNLLNQAPAHIWRWRYHAERDRAAEAIIRLSEIEAFLHRHGLFGHFEAELAFRERGQV